MTELTKEERKFIDQQLASHNEQEVYCVKALIYSQDKKKGVERIFVIGENRVYAIKVKGSKIDVWLESHILDISEVSSSSFDTLMIKCKNVTFSFEKLEEDICQDIIEILFSLLKQTFPGKPESLLPKFSISPEDRFSTDWFEEEEGGPCGDFVKTYRCMCDYYGIAPREDLCYDFDIIYPLNSIDIIDFNDLGLRKRGLTSNDIKAITMALSFNKHFTAVEATDCKLGTEGMEAIANMMKHNTTIKSLSLSFTGTTKDSIVALGTALQANSNHSLTSIDISRNELEEKGMISFANAVTAGFQNGLTTLKVADTLSGKGVVALAKAIELNTQVANSLLVIDLGGNKLDVEGSRAWGGVFQKAKNLRRLNLQRTSPSLTDVVCDLMEELILLDFTGNKITMKDMLDLTKCISFCPNLEQFYVASCGVHYITLHVTHCKKLTGECVQYLFGNPKLLAKMSHLDLSDNELGDDGVVETTKTLASRKTLKNIRLNKIWGKKTKNRAAAITALTDFVGKDGPGVETLELAGNYKAPLKADILPFIFSLMTNRSLRVLDVSGHQAGNVLGVGLGKVLQTNYTLEWLGMDDNNMNYDGYRSFKAGLDRNTVLRSMPFPTNDFMTVMTNRTQNPTAPKFDRLLINIQSKIYANALHLNTEHKKLKEKKVREMEEGQIKFPINLDQEVGEDVERPPEPKPPLTPTSHRVLREPLESQASTPSRTLTAQIQRARGEAPKVAKQLFPSSEKKLEEERSKPAPAILEPASPAEPLKKEVKPELPVAKKPEPITTKGLSQEIPVQPTEPVKEPPKEDSESEDETLSKPASKVREEEDVEIPTIQSVHVKDAPSKETDSRLWAQKKQPPKNVDSDEDIPTISSVQMPDAKADKETGSGLWAQKKQPPKNVDSDEDIPTISSVQMPDAKADKETEPGLWAQRKAPPKEEDDMPTLPSVQMPDAAPRKQSTGQWAQKTNIKEKLQEKEEEIPTLPSKQMPDAPAKKVEDEKWAQKVEKPVEKQPPAKQQPTATETQKKQEEEDPVSKAKPKGNNVESIYTEQGPANAWDEGSQSNKNSLRTSKRPMKKYLRVKPSGIDTMRANQLFGELENYLTDNVPVYDADDIEKARIKRATLK